MSAEHHRTAVVAAEPLISIVIPCFNAERTIGESIDCCLQQTSSRTEIIVVDDGSTDGSGAVIRSFGDRVHALFGSNQGASAARNRGTSAARGEFLQYVDADDLLTPDAIERRVEALRTTGSDVAYSDWQTFEDDPTKGRILGEIEMRTIEEIDPEPEIACASAFWAPPAALLFRRSVVDAIGGWNPRLPVIQDARFLFDAARSGAKFVHVKGVSAFYRVTPNSLSRRDESQFVRDAFLNGCEIQSLWQADGPLGERQAQVLAGIFDYCARPLFRSGAPEFEDAVNRLSTLSRRRFGYPAVAMIVLRLAGPGLAPAVVDALARTLGCIRPLAKLGKRGTSRPKCASR